MGRTWKTLMAGSIHNTIYMPTFKALKILVPPLPEQKAIAEVLSDTDALIVSLEQLLTKKLQIKQGAMQELLTGQRRLPGFTSEWMPKQFGELLTIRHGKNQRDVESADGDIPILATGGEIGKSICPLYDKPSVLIGRKGTIDKPQYMDVPFWTVDTLFYSEIHAPNSAKFLFYRFCLVDWRQYNEASGVPSLNAKTIESVEILCPDENEQNSIAFLLDNIDGELAILETKLKKARQLKQGMMQELLSGRIRLV
jgi:type I restriction enzyme S subunit